MTLWILGANGQVGAAVAKLARARGIVHRALAHADLDIRDGQAIAASIGSDGAIVNCAAYTAVDRAETEPELARAINATAVAGVARLAAARRLPLIHLSTDYVFDGAKTTPYIEDDIASPASSYGRSKAEGETAVRALCPHHIVLRTAWVYAAGGDNFVSTVLRLADERPALRMVADQHGGPTSASDIADAILTIVGQFTGTAVKSWGTYHFTGAPATSRYDFARAILAGREGVVVTPITTADYPTAARRPANGVLDCTKIHANFGIRQPDWRKSLAHVLSEIRQKETSP